MGWGAVVVPGLSGVLRDHVRQASSHQERWRHLSRCHHALSRRGVDVDAPARPSGEGASTASPVVHSPDRARRRAGRRTRHSGRVTIRAPTPLSATPSRSPTPLPPQLLGVAAAHGGVFSTAEAGDAGLDRYEVCRLQRRGVIHRLRRGYYVARSVYDAAGTRGRTELEATALARAVGRDAVLSHETAAILHGLAVLDRATAVSLGDPDAGEGSPALLHLTRPTLRSSRTEAGVHHHDAELPATDVVTLGRLSVTSLARTALDVSRGSTFRQAVVALDSAYRLGATVEQVSDVLQRCRSWPGARVASLAVASADPASGSPGESLLRVLFAEQGLPAPATQVPFRDDEGLIGVADFYFEEHSTVGEFDGLVKYGARGDMDSEQMRAALVKEKLREDRFRGAGLEVVRTTWPDLFRPSLTAGRYWAAFGRAGRRSALSPRAARQG